jgi:cytochrome c oxidase subunit 2
LKKRTYWILVLVIGVVALQACGGEYPQSALHPSSDFADRLSGLFNYIFWLAVGVFVIVEAIIVVTLIRFREKPGDERPKPVHGHTGLEIGWTLLPAVILVLIAIPTVREIFLSDNPPESDALTVEVIGKQWWWEFRYPEEGIVTANEAHIPIGRTVEFRVRSADVLHSFWVPRLAGKRDLVPGRENMIWFRPDSAGVFWGQCAEYCGTAHALMSFRVVVESEQEYDAWVQQELAPAGQPSDRLARLGQGVFMTNACIGCHRIDGTQASGVFGPDLTHVGSRTTIAAGVLDNTTENLIRWIANPQEVKPGNLMPNMDLTDDQVEQLAAYLMSLR